VQRCVVSYKFANVSEAIPASIIRAISEHSLELESRRQPSSYSPPSEPEALLLFLSSLNQLTNGDARADYEGNPPLLVRQRNQAKEKRPRQYGPCLRRDSYK
jgi:hypothetical protein